MRKIQIEKNIKKFEEFNKEKQEEILNNYRDINVDFEDWNGYILNEFIDEVKQKTDLEINTNDIIWEVGNRNSKFGIYAKSVLNQLLHRFESKGVYDIDTTGKLGSFLFHRGGGICSQNHTELSSAGVNFEDDNITMEKRKAVTEQINKVIDEIIELSTEYHNRNEKAYNNMLSDESVKDTIEANEYEFDEETLKIY